LITLFFMDFKGQTHLKIIIEIMKIFKSNQVDLLVDRYVVFLLAS
jgi:hypothetical protein